jgi:hypothetical protein
MLGSIKNKKAAADRRLLLLSCSQRKRRTRRALAAIELYDGPAFRILRRYLSGRPTAQTDVLIVSAKWGVISGDTPLPNYDRRMTASRLREIRPLVITKLREVFECVPYSDVFISMSENYLQVIQGLPKIADVPIYTARGGRARRLSALYDWLHGGPPSTRIAKKRSPADGNKKPHIRGVEVRKTKAQVLALAKRALRQEPEVATRIHSWYVPLDKKRLSPKWLAGKLTGLSVSAFTTDEARRMLTRLGVEVRRVSGLRERL